MPGPIPSLRFPGVAVAVTVGLVSPVVLWAAPFPNVPAASPPPALAAGRYGSKWQGSTRQGPKRQGSDWHGAWG